MNIYVSRLRAVAKLTENVKAEVKQNGKGEMKTIGLSAVEGLKIARTLAEANMRGS